MKINSNNYYQFINQIGVDNLLPGIKQVHAVIDKLTGGGQNWSTYSTYKDRFEKQFEALELFMDEKNGVKSEPKEIITNQKEAKLYKEQKPKETKPYNIPKPVKSGSNNNSGNNPRKPKKRKKLEKPKVKGKGVELISPEVAFIKRFVSLHNKTKTKDQLGSFIRSLQKAIVERRIRKTSRHANTIREIQTQLVNTYKKMGTQIGFEFAPKDLNRYYKIAGAEIVMPSIRFIKSFLSLKGKEITKHKAKNLLDRIKKGLAKKVLTTTDKYYKELRTVINSLEDFLNQQGSKTIHIKETQLNGLEGALKDCGCESLSGTEFEEDEEEEISENEDDGVMTVDEARKAKFRPVELSGEWLKLIGEMCLPTNFLVYGFGGSGKTSFVLLFTQYLASLGYRILYVAREQYNTPTFTELLNRLNIVVGENFKIVKDIDVLNPKDFDFVVLDSKDDMNIELPSFVKLKEKYPTQSFIMISQGTKDGNFTGTGRWRNVVDVMVFAEKGLIKTGMDKNRWGGSGEMRIY